ncbi:transmembrane channel-like protein 8 [Gastrophryne carolinensis]
MIRNHTAPFNVPVQASLCRVCAGKFGSSIRSYFSFLRFLMLLNFTSVLLTAALIILPSLSAGATNHTREAPCGNSSAAPTRSTFSTLLDVFTGEGFMEDTYLFYGHYREVMAEDFAYELRLAYLLTPFLFLILCSLGLLQCTVTGITQRRVRRRNYRTPISSQVFSSWDFCVQGAGASALKQQGLGNYLKCYLAEERRLWGNAERSVAQVAWTLLLRLLLNCVIVALMAGAFYSIYLAASATQEDPQGSGPSLLGLVKQYRAPIVISLVLLILPHCFMLLVKFEGHSPSTEITLTLIRCVFLRLGTLGIFFFSLGRKILCLDGNSAPCEACGYNAHFQCWETAVGQELYKLSVFHFLKMLMEFFFLQLPRRFLLSRWLWTRWISRQTFPLSQNVLDAVYGQTLVLGGLFYAPLLPLLNLAFLFFTFYIKKFSLYRLCNASKKLHRESTLRMLFYFVLLLGILTVFLPLIYLITSVRPSRSCGPFADYQTSLEAVQSRAPSALLVAWSWVTSETSAYIIFFILWLVLTAFVSCVRQNEQDMERLKELLSNQIEDKKYLVGRLREEQQQLQS